MNDNLITEIIDLNKVKANLLELQKMWEQLIVNMAAKSGKDLKFDNLAQNLKTVTIAEAELAKTKQANLELDKKIAAAEKQLEIESKKRITDAQKQAAEIEKAAAKQAAAENKAAEEKIKANQKIKQSNQDVSKTNADLNKKLETARKVQESESKKAIAQAEKEAKAAEAAAAKEAAAQNKASEKIIAARKKQEEAAAKEAAKRQEVARAANMEVKSDEDLNKKLRAQIELRSRLDKSTEEGKMAYDNMTKSISALYEQQNVANKSFGKFTNEVGRYPQSMGNAGSAISKFSVGAVAAYAAISMAASKVINAVKGVINEFLQADKVQQLVNQSFGKYSDVISEQANAFEKATGIEAEQFMKLSISAKAYGAANEDVAKSINLSLGLAKEFELQGVDSETALRALVKAQNGQYAGLEKIYPALKNVASESEKMRIVNELSAKGWEKLNAYTATYSGQIDLVNHAIGNLKEQAGQQVLEGVLGKPEEIGKATTALDKVTETLEKTGIIAKYLTMVREQAKMMLEPFLNLFKIFGEGGSAIDGLVLAVNVWFKVMQAVQTHVRLVWSFLSALTGVVLDVTNAFKGKGELKSFQDGLNIINKAIVELLSPISELVGMSDEVSKFFGVQREQINLTADEYKKLNALLFDHKSIIEDVKKTIVENEETKKMTDDLEEQENAIEEANKRYADYLANIKKANEEAKLSIELGENRLEVRKKEIEAIYSATKAYFELNGYTADEIKKLKELRAEIDKLSAEIANTPKLLEKQDVEAVKSVAKVTGEISTNMRNVAPATNDAAAAIEKMDLIIAKVKNAFNDFFGTEQVEDWRDTFVESMTVIIDESIELFNTVVEMQQEQLEQELDTLNTLYDKQMSVLEGAYDKRKKLLEATIDDEEELAAALARIEEEKAAVQAKFADDRFKKEQEIARKQAILEKKKAAVEVATGSATALVEAIKLIGIATTTAAPGDPYSLVARIAAALAAALTVVGSVTAGIAKVKAIEIPQFWTGGEAQEGQLISVAERGKELAVGESGKSYMFDKQSVIVAPEKMRIFSNKETKQIMEKQTINNTYEKQSNVNLTVNIDNERHKKYFKLT